MSEKIQMGIACGVNCEPYVKFLIDSVNKTASNPSSFEYILGINKFSVNVDLLKAIGPNVQVVNAFDSDFGSISHGKCLDAIFGKINSHYGMIVDCDVAFLQKGWDNTFKALLNENVIVVGSEYDGNKYMNFPNVVGCFFLTKVLKKLKVSFAAKIGEMLEIDASNSLIYNRQVGEKILLDVGWEMCYKLKTNNYKGVTLPLVNRFKEPMCKFIINGMKGVEYQLNGVPMFTHAGRSSSRDFFRDENIIKWRNRVEEWMNENSI